MSTLPSLPAGVTFLERGWLSSNNIVLLGRHGGAVVDTGYETHSEHTVLLVRQALAGAHLDFVVNTHLHSDHCGGNAALQAAYPSARTLVPPGQFEFVKHWDPTALSYVATGQTCAPFQADSVIRPAETVELGEQTWEIHAAPGHDPHSVVLFEPRSRTLISADALWENGFGVVFPELEGSDAFDDVALTLDTIEVLHPKLVLPGHGPVFGGDEAVRDALRLARSRLQAFRREPMKHASHAAKVLLKFKLLELRRLTREDLYRWARATPYLQNISERYFANRDTGELMEDVAQDLVRRNAAVYRDGVLFNA